MRALVAMVVRCFGYDPQHAAAVAGICAMPCILIIGTVFDEPRILGNVALFIALGVAGVVYLMVWIRQRPARR
jgi:hypothetical protein